MLFTTAKLLNVQSTPVDLRYVNLVKCHSRCHYHHPIEGSVHINPLSHSEELGSDHLESSSSRVTQT